VKPFEEHDLMAAIETASHRHRAEQRLQKMERWLATTLQSIGDGVISVDLDGRVTFLNAKAEEITGWS
jgi:PAS domain-containing protein